MPVFCLQPETFYFIQAPNAGHQRHRRQCLQRRDGVCDHSARWWENDADMWSTIHLFDVTNTKGPIKPHCILKCMRRGWVLTVHCLLFFVLCSTWWASSHPGSKTNHHYLCHGAVEGISTFLIYWDTQGKLVCSLISCCLCICVYASFTALKAIIVISWTRKGQLSMEEWSEGVSDKQSSTRHWCVGEMIILLRLYQQVAFYRARGANSRNVQQQQSKKERKRSCLQ